MYIQILTDKNMPISEISDALYSSFAEHLGRSIYEGIYEPGHPLADEDGFRTDVLELVKGLKLRMVRYPGGNFLSGYNWRDGIGPKEKRPIKLDLAWKTTETNRFGTDEFMKWCKKAGVEPMMAVNLGSGSAMDAAELVEYCNHDGETSLTAERKRNGGAQPYRVKMWCLGNEMDADGQIGHLGAQAYADKAKEATKLMRYVDESLELVCCGSCSTDAPTYPEWDRIVLETLYDRVEYLSLHQYFWADNNDNDFYASSVCMDRYIETMAGVCDYVRTKLRSKKQMMLSFDEWNIWNIPQSGEAKWGIAPHILEDSYTLKDAIVFASLLNSLLCHCDRVKCACLAQLVNVIAPIITQKGGAAIRQTTYYPFALYSAYARGIAYRPIVIAPKLSSEKHGEFPAISVAIAQQADGTLNVFLSCFADETSEVELELRSFGATSCFEHIVMQGELMRRNCFETPDCVKPEEGELVRKRGEKFTMTAEGVSFHVLRFHTEKSKEGGTI